MARGLSQIEGELGRLNRAPLQDETPGGVGAVRFVARCPFGANDVLARVISVLGIIDEVALSGWPTVEEWAAKLPEWFTSACAVPMTPQEAEHWLARWGVLSEDEQARAESEKDWSLDDWLYWDAARKSAVVLVGCQRISRLRSHNRSRRSGSLAVPVGIPSVAVQSCGCLNVGAGGIV